MFGTGIGFLKFLQPFYDDEGGGGGVEALPEVPSPSSDDLEALAGDDDDGDDGDDSQSDEKSDDEDEDELEDDDERVDRGRSESKDEKEKADIEEKDEDEKEEKEEKEKPEKEDEDTKRVPSLKALKTAYPDIFKKFPHVRTAIAEHQQFRSLYSSVDEAREAANSQDNFNLLIDKVVDEGDFGFLFDEVNKADSRAAARMAKNILPALLERSKDLYMDVTEIPITQFVSAAYRRAKSDGNKNLENSALHIWKFLGKDGIPSTAQAPADDPREKEFQDRVKEFDSKKFDEARSSVNREITSSLMNSIGQAIDPNDTLKEKTKNALVADVLRDIDQEITGDQNHMNRVNRLWVNARRSSYANGHVSRITNAYLERAKQILPKLARRIREENNIKDDQKSTRNDDRRSVDRQDKPFPRPHSGGQSPKPRTIRATNPRRIDWNRTSDEDILSGRANLKK